MSTSKGSPGEGPVAASAGASRSRSSTSHVAPGVRRPRVEVIPVALPKARRRSVAPLILGLDGFPHGARLTPACTGVELGGDWVILHNSMSDME